MREADQAPAVHPSYLLAAQAEEENEGRLGEPFESLAPERTVVFYNALARLREIDPKNPSLTYAVPQHWVPSQEAVDSINTALTEALAAKQGNAPALPLKSWGPFDPVAPARAAEFDNAIARLLVDTST